MPITRTGVARETARRMAHTQLRLGTDIRRMRLDASLSLTELAAVLRIHRSHLARIETGRSRPSLELMTAIGVALGADLGLRYFAGTGPRLVDRFQAAMVEAFIRALHPRWTVRLEVPIMDPARGVIDAALIDRLTPVAVAAEFQSELRRLEQQIRWSAEKADGLTERLSRESAPQGGPSVSRLLVLRSTTATRDIARQFEATLSAAYPARTEAVVRALTTGATPWPGPGIAWMRLDRSTATLLPHPPRGVRLGR
jgi:transcriptional regulator with XRE-family HTH domain